MYSNLMFIIAMAAPAGQQAEQGNPIAMFMPIILIFLIMYLLIFRPQAKKQKDHRKLLDSLEKGDEVITAGGIYGTVAGTKKNGTVILLKIADNVKIDIAKASIASKITPEEAAKNKE